MTVCTARRRGVPFVRTRRRGLRSMSGHPAYAWGNPPTLRRSSFPQRALRPAGDPIPKHAWGCAPRPPNAQAAAGYERCFSIVRTAPQIRSQGACGAFYFGPSRNQIKNQPYKRRLAPDPGGRRPSGRGVPTRRGSRGPPRVTFGYFSSQKSNPPPGRRAHQALQKAPPLRQATTNWLRKRDKTKS